MMLQSSQLTSKRRCPDDRIKLPRISGKSDAINKVTDSDIDSLNRQSLLVVVLSRIDWELFVHG